MTATVQHITITHQDLIALTRYLADYCGLTGSEIADAVEKPWNWRKELADAKAEIP